MASATALDKPRRVVRKWTPEEDDLMIKLVQIPSPPFHISARRTPGPRRGSPA